MLSTERTYRTLMSCKIERMDSNGDFVVLRVSGRVGGEHVDTLRELIRQERNGLAIDLTEVTLADREAVRLLAASETNGIELRNCPAYIREWVTREKDRSRPELSDHKIGEEHGGENL